MLKLNAVYLEVGVRRPHRFLVNMSNCTQSLLIWWKFQIPWTKLRQKYLHPGVCDSQKTSVTYIEQGLNMLSMQALWLHPLSNTLVYSFLKAGRVTFIFPFLQLLPWDVSTKKTYNWPVSRVTEGGCWIKKKYIWALEHGCLIQEGLVSFLKSFSEHRELIFRERVK